LSTLSISHADLEEKAVDILRKRGFQRVEREVTIEGYGRADVAAFEGDCLKVVVECGQVDNEKVRNAKNLDAEFVWMSRSGDRIVEDVFQTRKIQELLSKLESVKAEASIRDFSQTQKIEKLERKLLVAEERFLEVSFNRPNAISEDFYDSTMTDYYMKRREERLKKTVES
jgi:hypothetical protein